MKRGMGKHVAAMERIAASMERNHETQEDIDAMIEEAEKEASKLLDELQRDRKYADFAKRSYGSPPRKVSSLASVMPDDMKRSTRERIERVMSRPLLQIRVPGENISTPQPPNGFPCDLPPRTVRGLTIKAPDADEYLSPFNNHRSDEDD